MPFDVICQWSIPSHHPLHSTPSSHQLSINAGMNLTAILSFNHLNVSLELSTNAPTNRGSALPPPKRWISVVKASRVYASTSTLETLSAEFLRSCFSGGERWTSETKDLFIVNRHWLNDRWISQGKRKLTDHACFDWYHTIKWSYWMMSMIAHSSIFRFWG